MEYNFFLIDDYSDAMEDRSFVLYPDDEDGSTAPFTARLLECQEKGAFYV